uniref:C2H2-type domain-containing protein n=1 Tax=Onchocerca volvulus TaxID=6282 RepID=A0A8R1Y1H5_ONCVO
MTLKLSKLEIGRNPAVVLMAVSGMEPRQKPVKCPECCERFHTMKNLAKHAFDEHKIEEQNFELQSRNFRSCAEFDNFIQYIRMKTNGAMTTISVKDKCTYMRCEMTERTPMKIRYTTVEIEAILLLLKEKHSPDWISHCFKENTLESDKLHAISSADIRSIMYSYLNSEKQEEILGLDREKANLNWTIASACNSATLLETISRVGTLPAKESASENEHDIMEITSANLSTQILPNSHLEPAKHSNSLLVEILDCKPAKIVV